MQTTSTVFNNLDKFEWIGTFSGFFLGLRMGGNNANTPPDMKSMVETEFNVIFRDVAAFNKQINLIYISTGTEERTLKTAVDALREFWHPTNSSVVKRILPYLWSGMEPQSRQSSVVGKSAERIPDADQ